MMQVLAYPYSRAVQLHRNPLLEPVEEVEVVEEEPPR
jgi:hypothetical protein